MNLVSLKQDENSSLQDSLGAFTFKACYDNLTKLLRRNVNTAVLILVVKQEDVYIAL